MSASSSRAIPRGAIFLFYLAGGILHFAAPDALVSIMPEFVPWPRQVVLGTGIWEILGAFAFLHPSTRRAAGIAMAVYAIVVFPANIKHALSAVHVEGLPSGWWYHGPRLALQSVIVWWALYCGEVISWPFARQQDRPDSEQP